MYLQGLTGVLESRQGQRKEGDQTGEERGETGSRRGAAGSDRYLGSRLRSERQRVQDGRWRPAGWDLVWPENLRPEGGRTIGCE